MSTVRTGQRYTKNLLEQENKKKENNKMAKDIYEIRDDYNQGAYNFKLTETRLHKLPENHIFDEDLSVKRNREMVQEHNAKVAAQRKAELEGQNALDIQLREDCITFLVGDCYKYITEKMAKMIYDKVYSEKHECMSDFFYYLEETADFVDNLIDVQCNPQKY